MSGGSAEGWLGGAAAVENGILPSWHEENWPTGDGNSDQLVVFFFYSNGDLEKKV